MDADLLRDLTIEHGNQVNIYQELVEGSDGQLNTSFLRRVKEVKDNHLRPKGFDPAVFANNPSLFIQQQLAELAGEERFDPYYTNPQLTGADQIEHLVPLCRTRAPESRGGQQR